MASLNKRRRVSITAFVFGPSVSYEPVRSSDIDLGRETLPAKMVVQRGLRTFQNATSRGPEMFVLPKWGLDSVQQRQKDVLRLDELRLQLPQGLPDLWSKSGLSTAKTQPPQHAHQDSTGTSPKHYRKMCGGL